jgi:acyl dehydratase
VSATELKAGLVALQTAEEMPVWTVGPLSVTDFVRYAGAGGDLNPIHHDEKYAQEAGMPSVFGMGMLHAGMLGTRLARWVGPDNIRSFSVRFTGQVWPGDTLTFHGTVKAVERVGNEALAELFLRVSQGDADVIAARATAVVAAR